LLLRSILRTIRCSSSPNQKVLSSSSSSYNNNNNNNNNNKGNSSPETARAKAANAGRAAGAGLVAATFGCRFCTVDEPWWNYCRTLLGCGEGERQRAGNLLKLF